MSTLKELRLEAHLSISRLSRIADVDRKTVEHAEDGHPVQDAKAYSIVEALSKWLGRPITLDDVDGLTIFGGRK